MQVALSLIGLPASYFIGRTTFLLSGMHKLLALFALGGTLWHIIPGKFMTTLLPTICVSVWTMTSVVRLVRILRNRGLITHTPAPRSRHGPEAFKFVVRVPQQVSFDPGAYVYLYFGLQWRYRLQSQPLMVAWYEHGEEDGRHTTDLTFFVEPRGGLTQALEKELQLSHFPSALAVWFDGPYGQDLHLEQYETVMLAAKGIGIAGVLPYARHLLQRRFRDSKIKELLRLAATPNKQHLRNSLHRDATRKVDLFWELEQNRQETLASSHLQALQETDPQRVGLALPSRTTLIDSSVPT